MFTTTTLHANNITPTESIVLIFRVCLVFMSTDGLYETDWWNSLKIWWTTRVFGLLVCSPLYVRQSRRMRAKILGVWMVGGGGGGTLVSLNRVRQV